MIGVLTAMCSLAFAAVATGRGTIAAQPLASEALQLEPAASAIAGRSLMVLCYRHGEPGDPLLWGGWGYVDLFRSTINLSKEACEGALAIVDHDVSVPLIQQADGALSLTHESYHLNLSLPLARRSSEGQTECRADQARAPDDARARCFAGAGRCVGAVGARGALQEDDYLEKVRLARVPRPRIC